MDIRNTKIDHTRIFLLWLPLAVMWIFMAFEQPGVNAVIARLSNPKLNLAAYGVMFPIALIIEAPIIQMLAAATALIDGRKNYLRLLHFMHKWAVGLALFHLLIGLTPLYGFVVGDILGVPEDIIGRSRFAFLIMLPWAPAIGYRRLWQGVLIRYGKTTQISYTMLMRLAATMGTLLVAYFLGWDQGVFVGATALIFGVIAGMVSSYLYARPLLRSLEDEKPEDVISGSALIKFYTPLILTSVITFLARPMLNFGIARAALPLESLAVWPVVMSVMFIFRSVTLAYQEVVVALLKEGAAEKLLRSFAAMLALASGAGFFLFAVTPLGTLWFDHIAGLSEDILPLSFFPTLIVSAIPVISAFISFFRGVLIYEGKTPTIARAVGINVISLLLMVTLIPLLFDINGAVLAAGAYTLSLLVEVVFLFMAETLRSRWSRKV